MDALDLIARTENISAEGAKGKVKREILERERDFVKRKLALSG